MPSTHTVRVDLAERSYDVVIGHQLLGQLGSFAKDRLEKRKCAVITSKTLVGMQYHGTTLSNAGMASLSEAGIETTLIDVPSGEQSKSLEVVADVCSRMLRAGLDRKSFVVALGGGVIGDLAGFAASIMMRGIPFIQVPTSLLAQVDSSVGGKTGVNTSEGKNLIGTFAQPTLVLA